MADNERYGPMGEMFQDDTPRVKRLKSGNWQFGHEGRHHGNGTPDCPLDLHHHHDEFCYPPTQFELRQAGIDPESFVAKSRA